MADAWGPLAGLAGEWESGEVGLDTAFSHDRAQVVGTPYREKCSMKPFGPVVNGSQELYGLDYKSSMWRGDEENPFHTEVGYWLWDAATGEVLKGFVVPRGITTLAGGTATADATTFTLRAARGDLRYGIGENRYLAERASTLSYEMTVTVGDDEWTYEQVAQLWMTEFDQPLSHSDRNTLHRVG
jgi:hypothetical protein